ncbi:MAG: V-type ATP synthase subunit C [Halobacteriaceae archaeon]
MSIYDASNYEYVVARVRHRRASLFAPEDYRNLLRMGPGEIARFMEETEYEEEINALGARHSGVDLIEYALNANLARHFEDLLRWSDGRLYEQVARYLRKFDAWNVKTVLRGQYSDTGREEIVEDLIEAGELDHALLEELAGAESIEAVVERLAGTVFGDALGAAYDDYEESGLLVPLENAVDRAYYEGLLEGVGASGGRATELYTEFLEAEIDFRNARNALRVARSGADIDPAEYFIEGGGLFDAGQLRQLAANPDALATHLRESRYGDEVAPAIDEFEETDSLIGLEHALEGVLLEYAGRLSNVYPLSVCPVLAFVLAKEREVENIRAIARGREAGLTEEEIEEELVML